MKPILKWAGGKRQLSSLITPLVSKKLLPDEAFVNNITRTIYIIEKKFQHRAGSVDEKLQTCDFKLKQYKKLANLVGFDIEYIFT